MKVGLALGLEVLDLLKKASVFLLHSSLCVLLAFQLQETVAKPSR